MRWFTHTNTRTAMKHIVLLLMLLGLGTCAYTQADNMRAQVLIPPGIQFARGMEQQLQAQLSGFDGNQEYLRTRAVEVNTVPGVIQFTLILDDDNHNGYFDLRFSASTKAEFETMLREIFCRLNIRFVMVNDVNFENCRLITLP